MLFNFAMGPEWELSVAKDEHLQHLAKKQRLKGMSWKHKLSVLDAIKMSSLQQFLKPEPTPYKKNKARRGLNTRKNRMLMIELVIEAEACIGSGSPGNCSSAMVVSTSTSSSVMKPPPGLPQPLTRGQVQMIMHESRMLLWKQSMRDDQFAASQSDDEACCGKSWSSCPW